MAAFMLLLHDNPSAFSGRSQDDMMNIIKEYSGWSAKLRAEGKILSGEKLTDEGGKIIKKEGTRLVVTDGPYAEAREVIGGFFTIQARDYAEAVKIAETCPHAKYGAKIEVRQVHEFNR